MRDELVLRTLAHAADGARRALRVVCPGGWNLHGRASREPEPVGQGYGLAPKAAHPDTGGVLTLGSDWSPPLGEALERALIAGSGDQHLNLRCVAAHGHFIDVGNGEQGGYEVIQGSMPATAFLFRLISSLQASGTVPMIDVNAYAKWIPEEVTAT